MLKFLKRSPLRVLAVILFMVVTLPSQKALGAEMTFEQADAYLQKVMGGPETFDEDKVLKAVDVISAKLIRDGDSQATVPNILSSVFGTYTLISLQHPSRQDLLKTYRNKQGKSLLHLLRDLGKIPDFLEELPNDQKICKPLSDMLQAKDSDNRTPLDGIFPDRKMLQSLKIINPELLEIPTGPDKITPGIRSTLSPDPLCAVPEVGSLLDPLFQSFWQQDVKNKKQANTLWKEYLLVKKNHDSNDFFKSAPLRIKVLDTLSRNDALHPTIKSTALGNMISTGGTFGINFKRTARNLGFEEILAMHRGIASYVGAVYAVKNREFRAKEYVGLKEEQILSNISEGVALRIRDDLMPKAEKLEELRLNSVNKTKLANHQMTCAVLAARHLLRMAPSEYGEDLNRHINLLLDENSSVLKIGGLEIEPDIEGRLQRFDRLFKEKRQEYEQKMETLRTQQAAARQERERDDLY